MKPRSRAASTTKGSLHILTVVSKGATCNLNWNRARSNWRQLPASRRTMHHRGQRTGNSKIRPHIGTLGTCSAEISMTSVRRRSRLMKQPVVPVRIRSIRGPLESPLSRKCGLWRRQSTLDVALTAQTPSTPSRLRDRQLRSNLS